MQPKKKDNSTIDRKVSLRRLAMKRAPADAFVLETHGGYGRIYERVYYRHRGVVIEKDQRKASQLSRQRPRWRVYQGLAEKALGAGLAADTPFDLIDIDPYGSPFEVIDSLFRSDRAFPDSFQLVVNDGMRQKVRLGGAWSVKCLHDVVARHGNDLLGVYIDVAREMVAELANRIGYAITNWTAYYCGHNNDMTHYWATLGKARG